MSKHQARSCYLIALGFAGATVGLPNRVCRAAGRASSATQLTLQDTTRYSVVCSQRFASNSV
jgi:hypothetical protein